MTANKYLFDTCVFIKHLRSASPDASQWIVKIARKQAKASISSLTLFEIMKGATTDSRRREYRLLFSSFVIVPVSKQIAARAAEIYLALPPGTRNNSFNLDVLIAATAEYIRCDLVTENTKDFSLFPLKNIQIITI